MNVELTIAVVSVILALSVTSERLVEIIKGIVPWLNVQRSSETEEGWRRSALQGLAVASAVLTAYLAGDYVKAVVKLPESISEVWAVLGLGLLASGGSGLWNSVLTYLGKVKDIKKLEAQGTKSEQRATEDQTVARGTEVTQLKKA
jgi:hypothetical protein